MVFSAGNVPGKELMAKGIKALKAGSRVEIQLVIPNSNKIYILSQDEVSEVLHCITNKNEIIEKKLPDIMIESKKNSLLSIRFNPDSLNEERIVSLLNTSNGFIVKDGNEADFLIINRLDNVINRILSIHS